jgi:hypothetical protein
MTTPTVNESPQINETAIGLTALTGLIALAVTRSLAWGVAAAVLTAVAAWGFTSGWWSTLWAWLKPRLSAFWYWLRNRSETYHAELYRVYLGYSLITGNDIIADIRRMMGIALWTTTGGGKSSVLHLLISQLVSLHTPEQVQFAISDLKKVEMDIWESIPHLFCPIAYTVEETDQMMRLVMAEKDRRAKLFNLVANGRVKRRVQNLEKYHQLKHELGLDLPDLPILYVIFDETSEFVRNTGGEGNMVTLAEQGRAYSIFPISATQNPIAESIPTAVKRQLITRLAGIMPASAYQYADVPKEVHKAHGALTPGQFYISFNSGTTYDLIQTPLVADKDIEAIANALSRGRIPPAWPEKVETKEPDAPEQWSGSDEDKRRLLFAWFDELQQAGDKPRPTVFAKRFNVSRQTFSNYQVRELWKEYVDG